MPSDNYFEHFLNMHSDKNPAKPLPYLYAKGCPLGQPFTIYSYALLNGHQFACPKFFTRTGINSGSMTNAYKNRPTRIMDAI